MYSTPTLLVMTERRRSKRPKPEQMVNCQDPHHPKGTYPRPPSPPTSCNDRTKKIEGGELPYKDLTATVKRTNHFATWSGSWGDIWQCELAVGGTSQMVAVKVAKPNATQEDADTLDAQYKKLRRELKVWAGLQHISVVPLLGVVSGFGLLPAMVSPWFKNGSLSGHLARDKAMDISDKQRLLAWTIDNVLIDDNGRACLTDFGLSLIIQDFEGTSYLKSSVCGAI
ncbi:hypothetical protein BU15DRAFT_69681, partial [Melanogaster broomeanus]